jgi:hypothetical protein
VQNGRDFPYLKVIIRITSCCGLSVSPTFLWWKLGLGCGDIKRWVLLGGLEVIGSTAVNIAFF